MKRILVALLCAILIMPAWAKGGSRGYSGKSTYRSGKAATGTGAKSQNQQVRGYTTKRGKYVAPHRRSTADQTKTNNWTTKGNRNPYTGKAGIK